MKVENYQICFVDILHTKVHFDLNKFPNKYVFETLYCSFQHGNK